MHILHTVLYTFSMVLTKRICFNQEFLEWVVFSFILIASMFDSGEIRIFALLEDKRFISCIVIIVTSTTFIFSYEQAMEVLFRFILVIFQEGKNSFLKT